MQEKINNDLKETMKSGDKFKLSVLRMLKSALQLEAIKEKKDLSDEEVMMVIKRNVKQRKDSISEFEKGGRSDLIEKTQAEIDILQSYLPEQLSMEEVEAIIDEAFEVVKPEGARDMGKVMKEVTPKVKGRTDMKKVSEIIKSKLQ